LNNRFYSLDVFRGATVALMILVNNPGSWSHIYAPLDHAKWHGCTPTDLVFPFFLFAVGNAMAFVMPKLEKGGPGVFWTKVIKRTLLIFLIGLFLNWSPFIQWSEGQYIFKRWVSAKDPTIGIRLLGVLQRIALCYFFASVIIYLFKKKGALIAGIVLLLGYWALCAFLGTSGDPYSLKGWFGTDIDKSILQVSHMYKGEGIPFDPEGLMNTMAAIVQVIIGYFVGDFILKKGKTFEMVSHLFVAGCALVFIGFVWDMAFPINKKLWTSSYVIYTSGLAILVLATLIHLIEFKEWKGAWSRFFDVFGKNPLFIFVLSGFLPRLLGLIRIKDHLDEKGNPVVLSPFGWFYNHICIPLGNTFSSDPKVGSLIYALVMIAFYWLIVYVMDKKKIYIKV
jgi:predicted acyltransferase